MKYAKKSVTVWHLYCISCWCTLAFYRWCSSLLLFSHDHCYHFLWWPSSVWSSSIKCLLSKITEAWFNVETVGALWNNLSFIKKEKFIHCFQVVKSEDLLLFFFFFFCRFASGYTLDKSATHHRADKDKQGLKNCKYLNLKMFNLEPQQVDWKKTIIQQFDDQLTVNSHLLSKQSQVHSWYQDLLEYLVFRQNSSWILDSGNLWWVLND